MLECNVLAINSNNQANMVPGEKRRAESGERRVQAHPVEALHLFTRTKNRPRYNLSSALLRFALRRFQSLFFALRFLRFALRRFALRRF